VSVTAGVASAGTTGAGVSILGGPVPSTGTSVAGAVSIVGGTATGTTATAGSVFLSAGTGTSTGGDVTLTSGLGATTQSSGVSAHATNFEQCTNTTMRFAESIVCGGNCRPSRLHQRLESRLKPRLGVCLSSRVGRRPVHQVVWCSKRDR
jgi:hypothetical protein